MKIIVHILSWSRIPLGILIVVFAVHDRWFTACVLLIVAALTDIADGWVARRFHVGSHFGANVVEPVCDMVLFLGAFLGLSITHVWPWWIFITAVLVQGILQIPASFGRRTTNKFVKTVVRHQYWFTPIMYLCFLFAFGVCYIGLALKCGIAAWVTIALLTLISVAAAYARRSRIAEWVTGPRRQN